MKIITDGTVKFTKPSEFNDPFDCFPHHETEGTEEYVDSRPDLIEKAAKIRGITTKQLIDEKHEMISRLKNAKDNGAFGQQLSDNAGIFSMTRDPLNLLMWAHYSSDHTGFVVELKIELESYDLHKNDIELFEQLVPYEVKYQQHRPVIKYSDTPDIKLDKQFLTKGIEWKYEQEERVIDWVRKSGIHKYDKRNILSSVIAGMKMDKDDFKVLRKTISITNQKESLNITLHQVCPVKNKFKIIVPDRPDLQSSQSQCSK